MKIETQLLEIPLLHRFAISRGATEVVRTIWIRVREEGIEGWGEAAAVKYQGQTVEGMKKTLELMARRLEDYSVDDLLVQWEEFESGYPKASGALAGLNVALWDWKSKKQGVALHQIFKVENLISAPTSFTIGIDTPEIMAQKVVEAFRYPILKVKLGFEGDLEVFRLLHQIAPEKQWRVDANGGWSLDEAIRKSQALEELGVELIEQPISRGSAESFQKIQSALAIPVYLDESVHSLADLETYQGSVRGVNLKLAKMGSLSLMRVAIDQAHDRGYQVMLGCMTCSSLHIAGIASLAPLADLLDLDGHLLLQKDPFHGLKMTPDHRFQVSSEPGLGLEYKYGSIVPHR